MSQTVTPVARHAWLVLALTCAAQFMGVLDVTIVNVALPSMRDDLALSAGGLQWVVNGYTLTFAGFLLLGGRAADIFGLKRVFLIGLTIFTVASLAGGLAETGWQLVAARATQGLGGAILTPATLSMITMTFPEGPARARALGIWAAVSGIGGALGGVIGGVLTGLLSWRWVLLVNVPLGCLLLVCGYLALVGGRPRPSRGELDLPGSVSVTLGTGCLVGAIVGVEQWGARDPATLFLVVAATVLLGGFVWIERHARRPLVPLSVFRIRNITVANVLSFLSAGGVPATFFFLSIHLQQVWDMKPLTAGVAMVPAAVGIAAGSLVAARIVPTLGGRRVLLVGSVIAAAALVWLARLQPADSYLSQVPTPLFLAMFGMGMTGLPLTLAATAGVRDDQHGLAAGLLNTTRQVGGAVGLAALVALASSRTEQLDRLGESADVAMTGGFALSWLVAAGLVLLTGLAGLALPGERDRAAAGPTPVDEAELSAGTQRGRA